MMVRFQSLAGLAAAGLLAAGSAASCGHRISSPDSSCQVTHNGHVAHATVANDLSPGDPTIHVQRYTVHWVDAAGAHFHVFQTHDQRLAFNDVITGNVRDSRIISRCYVGGVVYH